MDGQRQAQNQTTIYEPSQGSLSISLATLAHRWVPYAARCRTGHPDILHSSRHVPQLANAAVNPVKGILNFGEISSGNQLPLTSAVCTGDVG
jgi:hypothetical protein